MPGRWEAGRSEGVEDVEAGRRPNLLLTEAMGDGLRCFSTTLAGGAFTGRPWW